MAVISIEIDDADVSRVWDAISANYRRPDIVNNPDFDSNIPEGVENPRVIENPESKEEFSIRKLEEFMGEHVFAYESKTAKQAAVESLPDKPITRNPNRRDRGRGRGRGRDRGNN